MSCRQQTLALLLAAGNNRGPLFVNPLEFVYKAVRYKARRLDGIKDTFDIPMNCRYSIAVCSIDKKRGRDVPIRNGHKTTKCFTYSTFV